MIVPRLNMMTILTNVGSPAAHRFEALLTGASDKVYDQPLLERSDWLVVPTLGAVVSGWVLALPRKHVLSFREWSTAGGPPAQSIVAEVLSCLGLADDEVIWFEHGPARAGTLIGCGADHAHLHILIRPPFDFSAFTKATQDHSSAMFCELPASEVYEAVSGDASYCVAASADKAISALNVDQLGSQFFRRVVAQLTGQASAWNYRRSPHMEHIRSTIGIFKHLARRA